MRVLPGLRVPHQHGLQCAVDEHRVGHGIALGQSARLAAQSVEPLHADLLHPGRRTLNDASVIVERSADAEHDGLDLAAVGMHPRLLLRAAQAHKDDVGPGAVDLLNVGLILFLREFAEGGETMPAMRSFGKAA